MESLLLSQSRSPTIVDRDQQIRTITMVECVMFLHRREVMMVCVTCPRKREVTTMIAGTFFHPSRQGAPSKVDKCFQMFRILWVATATMYPHGFKVASSLQRSTHRLPHLPPRIRKKDIPLHRLRHCQTYRAALLEASLQCVAIFHVTSKPALS